MNLPTRQNKKRNQALDAFASIAKTWSEWRLGERAAQSVATGTKKASKAAAKARKRARKSDSSGLKGVLRSTPVRIAGAAALVGGIGAAVAKKLRGGGTAEPLYSPPPAPTLQDVPSRPSTNVAVSDLAASDSAVASSERAVAAASGSAGSNGDSAVAASEQAVADASPPPPSGTEPTVPDTDPEPAADTAADDEVEDAMDAHSDSEQVAASGPDAATEPTATSAADADDTKS